MPPGVPSIDVTKGLEAYKAVTAGMLKAMRKAEKASECAADEQFFWCVCTCMHTRTHTHARTRAGVRLQVSEQWPVDGQVRLLPR